MPNNLQASVLIIGIQVPAVDIDAGSLRLFRILQIITGLSRELFFLAVKPFDLPAYRSRLQEDCRKLRDMGVVLPEEQEVVAERFLQNHGRRFDLIILSDEFVASRYLQMVRYYCPDAMVVFDTVDLHYLRIYREARLTRNRYLIKMAIATRHRELQAMRESDLTLVTSDFEQQKLWSHFDRARIRLLPTIYEVNPDEGLPFHQRRGLIFVGSFAHAPNRDALMVLLDLFPRLRQAIPGLTLRIVGSDPPREIVENNLPAGIEILGHVENLEVLLRKSRLSVAPLRFGAGVKGKVLESMASGLPVIATPIAAEGIGARDGYHLAVGELENEFICKLLEVYKESSLWRKLQNNGRQLISENFSFQVVENILKELVTMSLK